MNCNPYLDKLYTLALLTKNRAIYLNKCVYIILLLHILLVDNPFLIRPYIYGHTERMIVMKKGKTNWRLHHIYKIMSELDCKCGIDISDNVDYYIKEIDNNVLAYCSSQVKDANEYCLDLEEAIRNNDSISGDTKEKLKENIIKIKDNKVEKFYYPTSFVFSPQVLCLPYEEFREIIIHEYAHALVNMRALLQQRQVEEDSHGEEFKKTVLELGGKNIYPSAEQVKGYNKDIYARAKEMGRQYNKPYTVHYTYINNCGDGVIEHNTYTVRRKYNCKTIKQAIENTEKHCNYKTDFVDSKLLGAYTVDKETFIIVEKNWHYDDEDDFDVRW